MAVYLVHRPFQVPYWPRSIYGHMLFLLTPTTHHKLYFDPFCLHVFDACVKPNHWPQMTNGYKGCGEVRACGVGTKPVFGQ